jgi:hypothetical protein
VCKDDLMGANAETGSNVDNSFFGVSVTLDLYFPMISSFHKKGGEMSDKGLGM